MDIERLRYIYLRRVIGGVLSAMPLRTAESLARRVARAIHALNTPGRRQAEFRASAALGRTSVQGRASTVAASMYEHIARFWVEVLFTPRLLRRSTWRRCVRVQNEQFLWSIAARRRGCIFATAYHGNIFAAAYVLGRIFGRIHVVVDIATHPYLRAWQQDLSRHRWIRLVYRSEAASELPRILASGGAVLMVSEHDRPRGRGVEAIFLGERRSLYPTLGLLACRYDLPVCAIACSRREEAFSFDLDIAGLIEPSALEYEPDEVVRSTMRALEAAILRTPEQYLWSLSGAHGKLANRATDAVNVAAKRRGIGSASSRRTHQKASGWQTPSTVGNRQAFPEPEAAPAPKG